MKLLQIVKLMILQQSLDTGDVPSDWRQANIPPIYKKGDWSVQSSNYRPVSKLPSDVKLLNNEHVICIAPNGHKGAATPENPT